ncbi:MAG: MFS transporter, partial [Propionibacteriaceae bacterium]
MSSTDVQSPPAATTDPAPVRTTRIIGILVVAAFVALFNETLLTVALPTLTSEFFLRTTTAQWVTSGFLLTMAVVIPTTGYLLQRFTIRALFIAALSLFTAGTLLAGVAPVFGLLIAGRVVQAGGTALVVPLLITTILRLVPAERRGATMGT